MIKDSHFSLTELQDMVPFEREIYKSLWTKEMEK